jgi:hypothetical protein
MYTIRLLISNAEELAQLNKAIHWAETTIPNQYGWRELYDKWFYPYTYAVDFTDKDHMLLFKLMLTGITIQGYKDNP